MLSPVVMLVLNEDMWKAIEEEFYLKWIFQIV
jgi:hypothetical protein